MVLYGLSGSTGLGTQGWLYNIHNIPNVTLDSPWYDQNGIETLTFGGKLYQMFGDLNLQNIDLTWAVLFNKELALNEQLPNLYTIVEEGEWTLDKLFELSDGRNRDENGDGKFDDQDYYGMVTTYERNMLAFMYGSEIEFVAKNEEGYPVYKPLEEKAFNVFSRVLDFYQAGVLDVNKIQGTWTTSQKMFMNNQILFYGECMQNIERLREMEVDFGVIPVPKYDAAQESYHSMVCDFPQATIIPATIREPDFVGFILEALYAKSHDTVRPAYVEKSMQSKYARDEESAGMIEIILDTMYYDPMYVYAWGGLTSNISSLTLNGNDNLASSVQKLSKIISKQMEKTIDRIKENP